ncbi:MULTISPECIES: carbon storage regulator CsrA [Dehalobacter]|jgi:carbon storage regulator|uniref:Translational regulator CsrA n=2 Tax=Dehalobacter restrictus TaxID=55583 RepID=A0A857DLH5_9FIRM|nr:MULTISPECIES: carbon storage regulator CsrA [Dehalobacter]AHF10634.1 carbon storage regulator CsrA [Dehalobacter restrictus DSM 9455]MDJ0306209.1 carbon storage regulator CsrA [Dehalobacter sp.]OCZ54622.1 carbon storage regulator [Dehalobacter sp. TeCB1]QHA01259.1 carbon storage regulator CsrA [Dehalobacter restrictus]
MLVLSRKIDEKIIINDNIEITIVSVSGDQVRIGINAPKDVKILRSEVLEEIEKQNQEASLATAGDEQNTKAVLEEMLQTRRIGKEKK